MDTAIYIKNNDLYFSHFDEDDRPKFKKRRKYRSSITSEIINLDLKKLGYDTIILTRDCKLSAGLKKLL